jgi:hypothetical protein
VFRRGPRPPFSFFKLVPPPPPSKYRRRPLTPHRLPGAPPTCVSYAKQLGDAELDSLARATPGLSGRDLRDVCEATERRWASKVQTFCKPLLSRLSGPSYSINTVDITNLY